MCKTYYLIIGCPRSGTTVLHRALAGHPSVSALSEELKIEPFFSRGLSTWTFANDPSDEKNRAFSLLYKCLASINANDDTLVGGCKCTAISPLRASLLVDIIKNHMKDIKVILNVRENLVAQYGSVLHARKSGVLHSFDKRFTKRRIHKLTLKRIRFEAYALTCLQTLRILRELQNHVDFYEHSYENFSQSSQESLADLFHFLGLPKNEVTWINLKKVLPKPEDYIINFRQAIDWHRQIVQDYLHQTVPFYKYRLSNAIDRIRLAKHRLEKK